MRKIKVYIAASLDGYIARPDGDLNWLIDFPNPNKDNYGYDEMLTSVDTVIMGGRTYHELSCNDILWPYKDKMIYVVSRKTMNISKNAEFLTEDIINRISDIRKSKGQDIWVAGGGHLITMLMNVGLIDELQICYIPIILGAGIPLFPNNNLQESNCELIENKSYNTGVIKLSYKIINKTSM